MCLVSRLNTFRFSILMLLCWLFFGMVVVTLTLLSQQEILADINAKFLSTYSPDSYRYNQEANLIRRDVFSVDELSGRYSGQLVTPKMGLPAMLAVTSFFLGDLDIDYNYLLSNTIFLFASFFVIFIFFKIMKAFAINKSISIFLFLFLFVFPLDLYWVVRFLREAIANIFLIGLVISFFASVYVDKRFILCVAIFGIFGIMFRAQLVLLGYFTSFLIVFSISGINGALRIIKSRVFLISLLLIVLGGAQSVKAAGISMFYNLTASLGLSVLDPIFDVFRLDIAPFLVIFIFILALYPCKSEVLLNFRHVFGAGFLWSIIIFVLVLAILDVQIRFMYPILISIKLLMAFLIINYARRDLSFKRMRTSLNENKKIVL